jgi:hypothetical protein
LDELGSLLSAWRLCGPWWPLLLGRNNCGGLYDQFVIARGRRGLSAWLRGFLCNAAKKTDRTWTLESTSKIEYWTRVLVSAEQHTTGVELNGVHSRKLMSESDAIFKEIEAYLLSCEGRKASEGDVKSTIGGFRRLLNLLDAVFSKLRTPHGEVKPGDFDFIRESLVEVDVLWKELDLPQTPK